MCVCVWGGGGVERERLSMHKDGGDWVITVGTSVSSATCCCCLLVA